MTAQTLAGFPARFEWVLDDLRALVSGRPIIAEGWGLRTELVAPIIDSPRRMVIMVAAHHLGIRVIEVDGSRTANAVASIVADYFSPYLPASDSHEA